MRLYVIKSLLCFILSISLIFSSTILVFAEGNSLQQADIKILTNYFKQKLNERKTNIDNFVKLLHNRTVRTVSITDVQFDAGQKTVSVKLKLNLNDQSTSNVTYDYQLRMSESGFQFGFCTEQKDNSGKPLGQELWFPHDNAPSFSRPATDEDVNNILDYIKKADIPDEDEKPAKPTESPQPTAPAEPTHSNQDINQGNDSDETTAVDNNVSTDAPKTENVKKSFWQKLVDGIKKVGQAIGNAFKSAFNWITGKSKSNKNEESETDTGTNAGTQLVDNKDSKPSTEYNVNNEPEGNNLSADTSKDENVKKSFGQKIVDGIKNVGQAIGNAFKSAFNWITGKSKSDKNEKSETNTESKANTESNTSQNDGVANNNEPEETVDTVESEPNKPTIGGQGKPHYLPE